MVFVSVDNDIDHQLVPLKKYVRDHLHWNERKDGPWCFKDWDESVLRDIMERQKEEVEELKQKGYKELDSINLSLRDLAAV